jgi:hypothetical protein
MSVSQAIEATTRFASVLPHLSELMSKIGMQLAIHRTDQSKLFPLIVLLQYARLSYASHCAILGCFVQIRTASVVQVAGHVLRKFRPSPGDQRATQRSGKALLHGFESRLESLALRLGRIDWMPARCELRAALALGESADSGRVVGHSELISNRIPTRA